MRTRVSLRGVSLCIVVVLVVMPTVSAQADQFVDSAANHAYDNGFTDGTNPSVAGEVFWHISNASAAFMGSYPGINTSGRTWALNAGGPAGSQTTPRGSAN